MEKYLIFGIKIFKRFRCNMLTYEKNYNPLLLNFTSFHSDY